MSLLEDPALADTLATRALELELSSDDTGAAANALRLRGEARIAGGRLREGWADLAEIERYDPSYPALAYAFLWGKGQVPVPRERLAGLEAQLDVFLGRDTTGTNPLWEGRYRYANEWTRGMLAVRKGDRSRAEQVLSFLDRAAPTRQTDSLVFSFARQLEGALAIEDGRLEDAIRALESAELRPRQTQYRNWLVNQTTRMMQLAELYHAVGRRNEALRLLTALGDGSWYTGSEVQAMEPDIAEAFLLRAEIYDGQGRVEEAIEYYTRFLETWRNPDPELQPRVDDARERLDELLAARTREPAS